MFYIDHNYDTNLCLTVPRQISTDPRICILASAKPATSGGEDPSLEQAKVVTVYTKISFQRKEEENVYYEQLPTETVTADTPGFNEGNIITQFETESEQQANDKGEEVSRTVGVVIIDKNNNKKTTNSGDIIGPFYVDNTIVNTNNKVIVKDKEGEISVAANPNNTSGLGPYFRVDPLEDYPFLGKFMHTHINLDFISTILAKNIDTDGKISIYTFLEQLMQGLQDATGNVNDYRILYDELSNTFYINDNNTLPNADKYFNVSSSLPTLINAHVLKDSIGSFVTSVSLKSELNNNYATMISVGAQSNGNVVGENATAFSKWNIGYEDRIITDRGSIVDDSTTQEGSGSKSPETVFLDNLVKYGELNNKINNGQVTSEEITNNGQAVVDMLKYEIAYYTQQNNMPGQGFLPINLQLTMLGLSGPRLLESYIIDETFLPAGYKNNIKFLTKGITHKIDTNGWATTLDSFSGPRADSLAKANLYWPPEQEIAANVAAASGGSAGSQGEPIVGSGTGVNANKLRATLKNLGYSEKGSEIDNGGVDITSAIEKSASSVLTTIKAEIPTLKLTVTGGNDKYHQGLSYNSRHKAGNAIDFAISPSDPTTLDKVVNILRRYAVGNNPNFRFIDEYRKPTGAATGGHFHISWGTGTESQAALNLALQLAKDGKITNPITVA